jgi:hypothetical protein
MSNSSRNIAPYITLVVCSLGLMSPHQAAAWGPRGHHSICEAATFLVKDEALKSFLSGLGPRMGHLCNIPDSLWRSLPQSDTALGNPTHFINPENANKTLSDVSANYKKVAKDAEMAGKVGSIWWRTKQFFDRAVRSGKDAKNAQAPKNVLEEQKDDLPYNKAIYDMIVDMGVMGHFVGDVSMPYHNRVDYDGRASGHGGIHAFYEEICVNTFGPDLTALFVQSANQTKDESLFDSSKDVIGRMRKMSEKSEPEAQQIETLDQVLEPSSSERRSALRKSPSEACPVFREMIVVQAGRSARLLASFWDEIYKKAGRPKLETYKSYRYPFKPDFVAPDYF